MYECVAKCPSSAGNTDILTVTIDNVQGNLVPAFVSMDGQGACVAACTDEKMFFYEKTGDGEN